MNPPKPAAMSSKDATVIVALDEYQQFLDLMSVSTKQLQSAHFDLAQARTAVGPRLSSISYDYRMRAGVHVKSEASETGMLLALGPPPRGLLQQDNAEEYEQDSPGGPADRAKDPLFWFGALPNPRLRSAQTQFAHALESLVAAASAKARLDGALTASFDSIVERNNNK